MNKYKVIHPITGAEYVVEAERFVIPMSNEEFIMLKSTDNKVVACIPRNFLIIKTI